MRNNDLANLPLDQPGAGGTPKAVPQGMHQAGDTAQVNALVNELAHYKAETNRLTQLVNKLTVEVESLRKAAQAWASAEITDAHIQRYGKQEPGLTLEEFIDELGFEARGQ
jgi:hypothetical protein